MKYLRHILVLSLLLLFNAQVQAATCSEAFPAAVNSNYSLGKITMWDSTRIVNEPNPSNLPFKSKGSLNANSCGDGVTCDVRGSSASSLTLPAFQSSNNSSGLGTYDSNHYEFTSSHYGNVNFSHQSTGSFATANTSYHFQNFNIYDSSTVSFPPGDYYFNNLSLSANSKIILDSSKGSGSVRFHIKETLRVYDSTTINLNGDANKFVMFIHSERQSLGLSMNINSKIYALIYVNSSKQGDTLYGSTTLYDSTYIKGRLSTADLSMSANARVEYAGDPNQATLSDTCTQASAVAVDHYEITHDSSALTCSSASVTVKACSNANCDLYNQVTNATLTKTIGRTTSVVDANSFTGSKSVTISQNTAATLTLGLTNLSPTAPVTCNGNGNCQLVFSESGFVVSSANIESCTQGSITIQALKSDQSQNCAPAWTGSRNIQLLFSHANKQSSVPMQVGNSSYTVGQTHTVSASFNNSAQATINLTYADAGAVTVQVSDPAAVLNSNSNTVNFYPNKLTLSSSSTTNNMSVNSDFNLSVAAQCSDNTVTPSYQASQLQFDLARTTPAPNLGGEEANLFYSASGQVTSQAGYSSTVGTSFSSGSYSYNQSKIDEYGVYQLQARDVNYLAVGNISSNTLTLGTFIPAQLNIYAADESYPNGYTDNRAQGQFQNVNLLNTYLGQSFSYSSQPAVAIIAVDVLGNALQNYTAALGTANLTADLSKITTSATDNGISLTSSLNAGNLTDNADGSFTYQFAATDTFQHQKTAANQLTAPFNTAISLAFANGAFFDANNGAIASVADSFVPLAANITSARLVLSNNFGPETDSLTLPIKIQSYNGISWNTASTDNTTALPSSIFSFGAQTHNSGQNWFSQYPISSGATSNLLSPATSTNSISAQSGLLNFVFAAPGEGNQGTMAVEVTLVAYPYLQFDWDENASLDAAVTTELVWGIYRGNDRIINWREIY